MRASCHRDRRPPARLVRDATASTRWVSASSAPATAAAAVARRRTQPLRAGRTHCANQRRAADPDPGAGTAAAARVPLPPLPPVSPPPRCCQRMDHRRVGPLHCLRLRRCYYHHHHHHHPRCCCYNYCYWSVRSGPRHRPHCSGPTTRGKPLTPAARARDKAAVPLQPHRRLGRRRPRSRSYRPWRARRRRRWHAMEARQRTAGMHRCRRRCYGLCSLWVCRHQPRCRRCCGGCCGCPRSMLRSQRPCHPPLCAGSHETPTVAAG